MGKDNSRAKKGVLISLIGMLCNVALASVKIAVGIIFGMISIVADGFNNFSDCGSSLVSIISFYIAGKPADKEHPYGHQRAEYISAMITGFLVLFLAFELFRESINKIISNEAMDYSWLIYVVLVVSIVVKISMFVFYKTNAKKMKSEAINANALDSLCDVFATTAVIVGIVISKFTSFNLDGWISIAVSLFICLQGIKIVKEASSLLLGQAPDTKIVDKIKEIITSHDKVIGMHDLNIYSYGMEANFATVHIEMDAEISPLESHKILDSIEEEVKNILNINLTAHLDPVDFKDEEAMALEQKICEVVHSTNYILEMHDFRFVRGNTNKVIFDIVIPYSCKKNDNEVRLDIEKLISQFGEFETKINIERK